MADTVRPWRFPSTRPGAGRRSCCFTHGIADRTIWTGCLESPAEAGHRALAVDLPGFGEAPAAPGEQAPWADVLPTMDELSVERAALVGNSYGGAVALRAALVAPDRVWALALVSAPAPALDRPPSSRPPGMRRRRRCSAERSRRPSRGAEAMARTLPGARHAVIEGAGHLAPLETPEAFDQLVLDFLRSASALDADQGAGWPSGPRSR